ncbi:hypothetical protein OV320_0450 [Actinobacteria bacterium OV320]|nr:hypothetical protein OV320_0450 [Actinobacteria bacterium OV320]
MRWPGPVIDGLSGLSMVSFMRLDFLLDRNTPSLTVWSWPSTEGSKAAPGRHWSGLQAGRLSWRSEE